MGTRSKRALASSGETSGDRSDSPSANTNSRFSKKPKVVREKAAAQRGKSLQPVIVVSSDSEVVSEISGEEGSFEESNVEERADRRRREEVANGKEALIPCKEDTPPRSVSPVDKARVTLSCRLNGKPLARAEAIRRWPHRYTNKDTSNGGTSHRKKGESDEPECLAHYSSAEVDHETYELGDCVHVNADGGSDFLGRILELYELTDHSKWLRVQWFFRAEDTALGSDGLVHDHKRVFISEEADDNLLECVVEKKTVIRVPVPTRFNTTKSIVPKCDYYYDMGYNTAYSTFYVLPEDVVADSSGELSTVESSGETSSGKATAELRNRRKKGNPPGTQEIPELGPELALLDLYSGCGAMSTGLCMGARLTGANLVSKWAVDLNEHACTSLKHNHPETEVRNESAEDFLGLLREWQKLCQKYASDVEDDGSESESEGEGDDGDGSPGENLDEDEFEVERILGIRWGGQSKLELKMNNAKSMAYIEKATTTPEGLAYKVRWKGYSSSDDTWEPACNLEDSQKLVKKFVLEGKAKKILPLPGGCDVICGGPPCQGASGFNRFRNKSEPLQCLRNKQIIVYMDIVEFLKPRFVLMENVVDILKFADGILGRYALSRLVQMHYQAKLGLCVAGCYGLPQFRMRVFLWGAAPDERLPPFPLPTHSVVMRGHAPQSWERNVVAYDESETPKLDGALLLSDAISDLPKILNSDKMDEMPYDKKPETTFQSLIRLPKHVHDRAGKPTGMEAKTILYDHRCLELNTDDFQRSCKIPKKKGANFRDLGGIIILPDGTVDVQRKNRLLLPSGKPLVPDYAISFVRGKSLKPFGRLWWDETVSTVVTRAEPHNQCILHPSQDRVLSIRENARLQGFPDFYKLFGPVKERYVQVGNAVAVPVARALGFGFGQSIKVSDKAREELPTDSRALIQLPNGFPMCLLKDAEKAA